MGIVTAASNVLWQWEGASATCRTQSWTRNEFLLPRDAVFMLAQIEANDFNDITLKISSEQGVAFNGAVLNSSPFIIAPQPGKRWNIQITGTSVVNVVSMYESSAEISPQ